jgi:recombination protein RecR
MNENPSSVTNLIDQLGRLPGIGRKSAERLAFHILRVSKGEALALAEAITAVRENVRYCKECFNLSESDLCEICQDGSRDQTKLCIVEQARDLMALEQAGVYRGGYHVLLGRDRATRGHWSRSTDY